LFLSLMTLFECKGQVWKGIKPLHSTRADVERSLGPQPVADRVTYDVAGDRVNVAYSMNPCARGWPFGWNVALGTVINVTVYFSRDVDLSDLQIELTGFEKFSPSENSPVVYYNNSLQGISVGVSRKDALVRSIEYFPSTIDQGLLCPEAAQRENDLAMRLRAYQPPALVLSGASLKKHDQKLHEFEVLLKSKTQSKVVIIAYGSHCVSEDEARAMAERVRNSLMKSAQPVEIMSGGFRPKEELEVFVVNKGSPLPLSTPTLHPQDLKDTSSCRSSRSVSANANPASRKDR
jgi:hypothetical protein